MFVGVLRVEIFIPYADSLKFKRQVVKSITDKIKANFNVSVCEDSKYSNLWRRAVIGVACVTCDKNYIDKVFDGVGRIIAEKSDVSLISWEYDII